MSSLYLMRHGQAGPRYAYDALSDLGHQQARLLGEYLASQRIPFRALFSGALRRQRETAEAVWRAYREAGLAAPEIALDTDWNEFDLDHVYRSLAPVLAAADEHFRLEYESMLRDIEDRNAPIHRTWSSCDIAVVRAWTAGRHAGDFESWEAFQVRVGRARAALSAFGPGEHVGVFTSATPIGIWTGMALGLENGMRLRLAGVLYNSALTTMRLRDGELTLFSFNGTPHLAASELRTFR